MLLSIRTSFDALFFRAKQMFIQSEMENLTDLCEQQQLAINLIICNNFYSSNTTMLQLVISRFFSIYFIYVCIFSIFLWMEERAITAHSVDPTRFIDYLLVCFASLFSMLNLSANTTMKLKHIILKQ